MDPRLDSRTFLSSLFQALSVPQQSSPSANPLRDLDADNRKLMLTLHVLFPNELLPALDLLDRNLVIRFQVTGHGHSNQTAQEGDSGGTRQDTEVKNTVYYVRSAQQRNTSANPARHSSRFRDAPASDTSYEVRLTAWNCSCPAFAFAAFPSTLDDAGDDDADDGPAEHTTAASTSLKLLLRRDPEPDMGRTSAWFGGLTTGNSTPPVCKHLLACVLVERCSMFSTFVEEKSVSREEGAGWAAGWGG